MALQTWLAFVAASAVPAAVPGPTLLLALSHALGRGGRVAAAAVRSENRAGAALIGAVAAAALTARASRC